MATKLTGKELAQAMANTLNCFSFRELEKPFLDEMLNEHRTLQASVVRFMKNFLAEYAHQARYDARNEAAVKFAVQVANIDQAIPFI